MFKTLKDWLLYPFLHDILFFCLVFVLISSPTFYFRYNLYVQSGHLFVPYYIYLGMTFFIISYLITLISNISKLLSQYFKPVIAFFLSFFSLLNFFCVNTYHCLLSADYIEIIAGTNWQETKEFVNTNLTNTDLLFISLYLFIFVFLSIVFAKNQVLLHKYGVKTCAVVLWVSSIVVWKKYEVISEDIGFSSEGRHWNFKFEEIVDLRLHPTHPNFVESDSLHPTNIIVVIGESFAKKHSSLYGYELETNPLLKKMEMDGNLIVFKNVESPATTTIKVFKYLLTTYQLGNESGEKKFYDYTNVPESFNTLHYNTWWISCQEETGMYDNLPSGYSKLCDHVIFDKRNQPEKHDDFLITALHPKELEGNNFIIYHMYGQHPSFCNRYPDSFCKFGPKNKLGKNAEKSIALADYDNATLFNDYVVSSIMDLYKDYNAIILYFSDHGMDLFDSDDSQFGHANSTELSTKIGKQIPFMIYLTNDFIIRYPQLSNRIQNCSQKAFCTDKLIYTLLDIAGYRFADNCDVAKFSLLTE